MKKSLVVVLTMMSLALLFCTQAFASSQDQFFLELQSELASWTLTVQGKCKHGWYKQQDAKKPMAADA